MQKLSYIVLNKLIEKKATAAEIDVLLYVCRFQNEHGVAQGIYYRQLCETLDIAYQTFYDAKEGLQEKGLITVEKNHYQDYDIKILDNDFTNPDMYQKGYLNTNCEMFFCKQFRNMRAGAKLLAMDLMKNVMAAKGSYHCMTARFQKQFMEKLDVCQRTLQHYMKELKLLFYIGIKEKQYWIDVRAFAKKKKQESEKERYRGNLIDVALRRNGMGKEMLAPKDYNKLDELLLIYENDIRDASGIKTFDFSGVMEKSLEKINAGKKKRSWKRRLKSHLIHRLLRIELGLEVKDLIFATIE